MKYQKVKDKVVLFVWLIFWFSHALKEYFVAKHTFYYQYIIIVLCFTFKKNS